MAETIAQQLFEEPKTEATTEQPPQATEPTPAPQAPVEQPKQAEPATPPPGYVPIAALMDERDKRKAEEAARKDSDSKYSELEKRLATQPAPSIQDDPVAWQKQVERQVAQGEANNRFALSERFALKEFPADLVTQAKQWAAERGSAEHSRFGFSTFANDFYHQEDPISWVVRQYKQNQLLSELGTDDTSRKAWIEKQARELGWTLQPQPNAAPTAQAAVAPPQPVAQPKAATPSLVHAQSAGSISTPVAPVNPVVKRLFGD